MNSTLRKLSLYERDLEKHLAWKKDPSRFRNHQHEPLPHEYFLNSDADKEMARRVRERLMNPQH